MKLGTEVPRKPLGTKIGTKSAIYGEIRGETPTLRWVMSPTSYRAAPPRTGSDSDKLNHSASFVNNSLLTVAVYAHRVQAAWDQNWDQETVAA